MNIASFALLKKTRVYKYKWRRVELETIQLVLVLYPVRRHASVSSQEKPIPCFSPRSCLTHYDTEKLRSRLDAAACTCGV